MSQLSNATLTTLQTTYYDDYDEDKKYYRILFRPAVAVQARELTQLQTAIQKQISRFGDNIFKDGSIVDGVAINNYANTPFVRLVDSLLTGNVDLTSLATGKYIITNGTNANAVRATVLTAQTGFVSTYPNTNQLYLNYYYTGKDGSGNDIHEFSNGQTLYIYNANQTNLGTLSGTYLDATINVYTSNSSTTSTGNGYCIGVSEGVVYHKGFFQKVDRQVTVVRRHDSSPNNYIVGFDTQESIVTDSQDASLDDNAQGFTNYNAPGAHRLKLNPVLVPYPKDSVSNTFFAVAEFDGGRLVIRRDTNDAYSKINEVAAQRTFEESGNYTIKQFTVDTETVTGNSDAFFYSVSPGITYVKGYRAELVNTTRKQAPRAKTTAVKQNQIITANYGNYVFVDDVAGVPDIANLGEVAIYDSAQNAISNGTNGLSSAPSGNIVGYANVKSLLYYSGTKGLANCQYYFYIFNIRMNPGKSFASDAKSFYKSSSPKFKADIVLDYNSKAVLYDTSFTSLVFNTGISAVKSLTPNGSSVDTTFFYRKLSSTSLNSNGTFAFSLSGGLGTGGIEQLYSTNARDYQITFTQNSYSSNVTGTISANTTSPNVTGTSTTFQTNFVSGDVVRFSNASASWVGVVNTVYSNTVMSLTANGGGTYSTYKMQHYYPDGAVLNVTDSMLSVNAAANSFTINTGITFDYGTGNTIYAQYPVERTLAIPTAKVVKKARYVKIDCSNNAANSVGPWSLGIPDVYSIDKIHVGTTYSNTTPDVSSWFTLNKGQKNDVYDHAYISIKPNKVSQITGSTKILVRLNHFEANTSAGIGFFSIDSYPVSNDGISSNSTTIALAEVPVASGYDLRNAIDFRPYKAATANSVANTDPANTWITINPANSNTNTFSVSVYGQYLAEADSQFTADYEYYLPRQDLVIMTPGGNIDLVQGNPELNPRRPLNTTQGSIIASALVPAFPSLTSKESTSYRRSDLAVKIFPESVKRYTMQDIGVLEERINRLEYYTVLTALEQDAKTTTIANTSTGLDRFKNGIFTEPFNSHNYGAVSDPAYSIAKDGTESVMKPKFVEHPVDLQYVSSLSSGVQKAGTYICLPYTSEKFISQPYASKYRVLTESIWQWNGEIDLFPDSDYFRDTKTAPAVNFKVDVAQPWQQFAESSFGTNYDILSTTDTLSSYRDFSESNSRSESRGGGRDGGNDRLVTTTETTTLNLDLKTTKVSTEISRLSVTTSEVPSKVGDVVQDVTFIPYIREQVISFVANHLKPNSKIHAFFDSINVDEHVAPGTPTTDKKYDLDFESSGKYWVTPSAPLGTQLTANSTGGVSGIFKIPDSTFKTGDRVFLLTNVDDLDAGANAQLTKATATFTASSLSVSKSSLTLTTVNPKLKINTQISNTSTSEVVISGITETRTVTGWDPIAQSFTAAAPEGSEGTYISQIGLYFKTKDPTLGVTVDIVEMINGYPNKNAILGTASLGASNINTSDDASVETVFTFGFPVYLADNQEYAFIMTPVGNSPEPTIWLAETGGIDITTGKNITTDSYSGIAFVSANKSTWTPIQKEDVKFNLYRAKYTGTSGTVYFRNENDEYLTISSITRINSSKGIKVGDVVYSQNSTSNTALVSSSDPFGVVQSYNEADGILVLDSTRAGFSNTTNPKIEIHRVLPVSNTALSNSTLIATANIVSVDNQTYHQIVPSVGTIIPRGTTLTFEVKGVDSSYNADSSYSVVDLGRPNARTDKARIVMSRTNEYNYNSNNKSLFIKGTLTTSSPYVSPVIDLGSKGVSLIEHIINNDITNEHTNNGNALCRYISKVITLADGQDAEDIKIYLRAHRPTGTDITVYGKFLAKDDVETFDTKLWTKLDYLNGTSDIYSSAASALDLKEYEIGFANTPATIKTFSANTGVNSAGDYILINNNPFVNNNLVLYYRPGPEVDDPVLPGLSNNTFYYVVNANTTALQLSSAQDGTAIAINATSNATALHSLKAYLPTIKNTAYLNPDNNNVVEYYNTAGSRFESYKYFAIKIVLTSTNGALVPKLNDMRAIALQV